MKRTYLALTLIIFLYGCNKNNSDDLSTHSTSNKTSIYATRGGNYGLTLMLTSAYSSEKKRTLIALGMANANYPYSHKSLTGAEYKILPFAGDLAEVSQLILDEASAFEKVDLYISVVSIVTGKTLTCDAFSKTDEINIIPEGTSIFEYSEDFINNIITFKNSAKNCGVNAVNLLLWDSIKENALLNASLAISKLPKNGVGYKFINFDSMANSLKKKGNAGALISSAFYSSALAEFYLNNPVFVKSTDFDEGKENIVFLGSYTSDGASYYNQIELLKKRESSIDKTKYNLIFKGHPRDLSVNKWIGSNSKSISYFEKFPYELWQSLGGESYAFEYKNKNYRMTLPKRPTVIDGIFTTSFYGEDINNIRTVFGFNKTDTNNNLLPEQHDSAIEDRKEFLRWQKLTDAKNASFILAYEWINTR